MEKTMLLRGSFEAKKFLKGLQKKTGKKTGAVSFYF
jgi:hypothetical protein